MGYGLSVGLPTGSNHNSDAEGHTHHGSGFDHHSENVYNLSPFLNAGVKTGNLEVVGWSLFHIPTGRDLPAEETPTLEYNVSALYHLHPRVEGLLEFIGNQRLNDLSAETNNFQLAPGLRIKPLDNAPLVLGLSTRLPVDQHQEGTEWLVSGFYHF